MQRRTMWAAGLAAGLVLAGSMGMQSMTGGTAFAADSSTVAPGPGAGEPSGAAPATPPSFGGDWRFDASRSDVPSFGGRGGRGEGRGGEGGRGGFSGGTGSGGFGGGEGGFGGGRRGGGGGGRRGAGGNGGGPGGGGMGGGMGFRMPDRMHVEQTDSLVSLADSTGRVMERITLVAMPPDTAAANHGIFSYPGAWNAQHELEVAHTNWRGTKILDTYAIQDDGRSLVVTTHVAGDDRMPARTIKRVYARVES